MRPGKGELFTLKTAAARCCARRDGDNDTCVCTARAGNVETRAGGEVVFALAQEREKKGERGYNQVVVHRRMQTRTRRSRGYMGANKV